MSEIEHSAPAVYDGRRSVTSATWFPDFYREQFGELAGYAFKLTRDPEVARDVAQEAFTRLLARWVGVREPRAYLYLTATNLVRDLWQDSRRERRVLGWLAGTRADVGGPDRTVADAVARLPEKHREVVLLFYYADLPLTDIAAAVGKPVGTVKWLLSDARDLLARALGDQHV